MSRMLEALKQIDSKRTASPVALKSAPPPAIVRDISVPIINRPNPLGDDPRLRFCPPLPATINPVALPPAKIVTPPKPEPIVPSHDFAARSQFVGQFDGRWSVSHSAIAPMPSERLHGEFSTLHSLALPAVELSPTLTKVGGVPLNVVPPSGEIAARYRDLVDQLLGELRQGHHHVLSLAALSHIAHAADVAVNLGIVLAQKKLGPVLLVETPDLAISSSVACQPVVGRFGEPGLVEAMQGEPWHPLVRCTALEGLHVLRAGVQPLDMELASMTASIESLWNELRTDYRFVLVSIPPSQSPVSDILACTSDRIYAVLELGASTLPQTQAVLRRWEEHGGHTVGCIALQ